MSIEKKILEERAKEQAEENRKLLKKYTSLPNHKMPVTRREFIASGLIKIAGTMGAPSILSYITNMAKADAATNCGSAPIAGLPAYIGVNLAGGAAMSSYVLAMGQDKKTPIGSYSQLGAGTTPNMKSAFGVTWNANSTFYQALDQTLTSSIKQKLSAVCVCVMTQDDSGDNELDISGLVKAAGLTGKVLPNLGQNGRWPSGNNNRSSQVNPPNPLILQDYSQIGSSLPQSFLPSLSIAQRQSLLSTISKLNTSQQAKLSQLTGGQVFMDLLACAGIRNQDVLSNLNLNDLDPRQNSSLNNIWQLSGKGGGDFDTVAATLTYNGLNGMAGTVNIDMGGYDYHAPPRSGTDAADFSAGLTVARVLNSAEAMNRKTFLWLTTDGSCATNVDGDTAGTAPFTGDHGTGSVQILFLYNPAGAPAMQMNQIGWFNGPTVDANFKYARNVSSVSAGIFLNYLAFAGQMSTWNTIFATRAPFASTEFSNFLAVGV